MRLFYSLCEVVRVISVTGSHGIMHTVNKQNQQKQQQQQQQQQHKNVHVQDCSSPFVMGIMLCNSQSDKMVTLGKMFSFTDFLFIFYLIFYHFISVSHNPFLHLLHSLTHKQSEPCNEPFALFHKLLSWPIRKDEERKHDLFSSCDLKASPPLFHGYFIIFMEGKRCCVCVCVAGGGGGSWV